MTTRITIAQSERALLWRQGRFVGILEPGVRWVFQPFACVAVQLYDSRVPEFEHPRIDELLAHARATMERHFHIVELDEHEMGVVYKNGTLAGTLAPGKRQLYWKGPTAIRVQKVRARRAASGPDCADAQSLAFL
ncbi:MAG TPA: hypothetical protein VJQ52_09100 [Steroidobacteraceae bacterium]|nr:hypothetical protein [Steroidobacteraceae bacterium]